MRWLLAVGLVVGCGNPAAAEARAASGIDVLFLEAAGKPVSTTFATDPGRTYTVAVRGVYWYRGSVGLAQADCGHYDPEDATGWTNIANVGLDGEVARCAAFAPNEWHSYSWYQRGTGAPFTFVIFANAYTGDDSGCLVVTVQEATATPPGSAAGTVRPPAPSCWSRSLTWHGRLA